MADFSALWSGRTNWTREFAAPIRDFLRTEAGSSGVLAGAIVLALAWANIAPDSYSGFWHTELSIGLGHHQLGMDLQEWINNGNFMGLGNERDPNVGLQEEQATFTIPKEPVRRRIHDIQTFNVVRGGEHLFLPSLSAPKWLAALDPIASTGPS